MKLLFVIPEYLPVSGGGIVTFYKNLVPALVQQGHEAHLLVGSAYSTKLPSYQEKNVTVDFLDENAVSGKMDCFNRYRALPELQRHLAAAWAAWEQVDGGKGYDVVEASDWGLLFAPWVIDDAAPPTVVQCHGSNGQIDFYDPKFGEELQGTVTRLLEKQLLSRADELQSYSQKNAAEWQAITGRRVSYIPPAWQLERNAPAVVKQSTHGLVVGRIQSWKGPIILCEALRSLGKDAPVIDWIGRDTAYQESDVSMSGYLARRYPDIWGQKIIPLGPRSAKDTAHLQSQAHFILVPSTWDVFNYTCVEGMGYARVVLCSDGAGAAGLIADGENGFVFSANDSVALAESLRKLQNISLSERNAIGQRAREAIETALSPALVAQQRLAHYEQLLQRGRANAGSPAIDPWLVDAVRPHTPLPDNLAFLDRLPLREISSYTLARSLKKIRR